jgi:hypothetical protein
VAVGGKKLGPLSVSEDGPSRRGPKPKLSPAAIALAKAWRAKGWIYPRIAVRLECSEALVQRLCRGIKPKNWTGRGNSERIIELTLARLAPRLIAERLGMTYSAVKTRQSQLRRLGRLPAVRKKGAIAGAQCPAQGGNAEKPD